MTDELREHYTAHANEWVSLITGEELGQAIMCVCTAKPAPINEIITEGCPPVTAGIQHVMGCALLIAELCEEHLDEAVGPAVAAGMLAAVHAAVGLAAATLPEEVVV